MDIKDTEKLLESFKEHPIRTCVVVLIFLALLSLSAYVVSYSGEKGKEHVFSTKEHVHVMQSPNDMPQQKKDTNTPNINQHTEGNQSPNVYVAPGGKADIKYGDSMNGSPKK
jgi:hypothetical protein